MQLSLFRFDPPAEKVLKAPVPVKPKPTPPSQEKTLKPKVTDPRVTMRNTLLPHLPEESVDFIIEWLIENKVRLHITRSRSSKLGDYRYPRPGVLPRISVNHNLNKYSFLITLVHEMAHHAVFASHKPEHFSLIRRKKQIKPHGDEWKCAYRKLITPFLRSTVFPSEILLVLKDYFENPRASSTADQQLSRMLKSFDQPNGKVILENLPFDSLFLLPNGRMFQKKEKIRTRYRCICQKTKRIYLFNPMAEVYSE